MSTLPHRCLSSTTFVTEEVKIKRPVRAKVTGRQDAEGGPSAPPVVPAGWRRLRRLDWRRFVGVRLQYVHGADPKVRVFARGCEWTYAWDTAVLDVLADVCNRQEGRRR